MASKVVLPVELVEEIISTVWQSFDFSGDQRMFMLSCPRVCRLWCAIYASISARDIYVVQPSFVPYISWVVKSGRSAIYRDLLSCRRSHARTMTCLVNLGTSLDDPAMNAYIALASVGEFTGLRACFPGLHTLYLHTIFPCRTSFCSNFRHHVAHAKVSVFLRQSRVHLDIVVPGLKAKQVDSSLRFEIVFIMQAMTPAADNARYSGINQRPRPTALFQSLLGPKGEYIHGSTYSYPLITAETRDNAARYSLAVDLVEPGGDEMGSNHLFLSAANLKPSTCA
ncbi:hypothetical protein FISHEDRAFT_70669 [Fistulina hepatica ATCC 64428]|uniref:Uncharacterized protein n=1 Tax=Fistulina hepatica ATCC 64428 TaxID=1128425 RepID=A0A0D7AJG0_9AGAR|nr:hypothetical protein FISHEDRAFT_70669 [Fistulina hepatica ATCC 64428]